MSDTNPTTPDPLDPIVMERAREKAAQAWCQPGTSHLAMIPELCEEFAGMLAFYIAQIDRLATVILSEIPGEPSQNQGAVDTAIRLLRSREAPSTVAPAAGSRCTWYQIEEGAETWESTCGLCYYFEDPPTADECKYCNKCGKPLDLEPWTPDEDEDEPEPSTPSQAPGGGG